MDPIYIPFVLLVGIVAGFINVLAGGGSLLTLPLLIFLGLPPAVANGTNRLSILIQNANAIFAFKKKGVSEFKWAALITLPAILGAYVGAKFAIDLKDEVFNRILAVVMILVLGLILFDPLKKIKASRNGEVLKKYFTLPVFFFVGFYGGFIQAGIGFVIIASLTMLTSYTMSQINAIKVFVIFFYTIVALGTFVFSGKIDWYIGLTLAIGSSSGAWLAGHYGLKMGDTWIKVVLTVAVLVFSIRLLIG